MLNKYVNLSMRMLLQIRTRYADHLTEFTATRCTQNWKMWSKKFKHTISIKWNFCSFEFRWNRTLSTHEPLYDLWVSRSSAATFMFMERKVHHRYQIFICTWRVHFLFSCKRLEKQNTKMFNNWLHNNELNLAKFLIEASFAICVCICEEYTGG